MSQTHKKTDDDFADSRLAKIFILENGFFVDLEDEMTVEVTQNDVAGTLDPLLVVALGIATTMLLASSLLIARRWRRRLEKPEASAPLNS